MSTAEARGGFVVDASALAGWGGEMNVDVTAWADRAAVRGIVLLVWAAALFEVWQQIRRHGPGFVDQVRDLLSFPMIFIGPLDDINAVQAGELVEGRDLNPDVVAAQVVTWVRARDWLVLAAQPARLHIIDPELTIEALPGMPEG